MCLLEHLEQSITRLSCLCSMALVIIPGRNSYTDIEDRFSRVIRSATTILERINRGCLTDVRVEFKADPLAKLGARLTGASAPLEACKQLEMALLTFPNAPVLVHDPVRNRRAGRAKFWSPIIRRAFPKLDDRGLLALNFTRSTWGSLHCFHYKILIIPPLLQRNTIPQTRPVMRTSC